nr:hypothetical protein [Tanacetum cinerariifolium]
AGCVGVVTALHQLPVGAVWPVSEIEARQQLVEADNATHSPLHWAVVESLPVHEDIKKGRSSRDQYIAHYQQSLRNLAACGIRTVCYNFMPVLDWSRTDLGYEMPDGSRALRFVWQDFAVFDLCILKRPGASADYEVAVAQAAQQQFGDMSAEAITQLTNTVLLGLPGSEESFELSNFQAALDEYASIDADTLTANLHYFIQQVAPVAEEVGIGLCIHPDDPPFPLLGLPRVVSTEAHLAALLAACDVRANGLTFCTGSLGVRPDNDLAGMVERFGERIHFVHLRTTKREENPRNFHEAAHLAGDVDMYAVVQALVREELRRTAAGEEITALPMRPDHAAAMPSRADSTCSLWLKYDLLAAFGQRAQYCAVAQYFVAKSNKVGVHTVASVWQRRLWSLSGQLVPLMAGTGSPRRSSVLSIAPPANVFGISASKGYRISSRSSRAVATARGSEGALRRMRAAAATSLQPISVLSPGTLVPLAQPEANFDSTAKCGMAPGYEATTSPAQQLYAAVFSLAGRVALVTGGGTGIGLEIARCMVAAGATVIITGRREAVLSESAAELGEGAHFVVNDVSDLSGTEALIEQLEAEHGPLDILVNNAGINMKKPALEVTDEDFSRIIHTNLNAVFALTRAAARRMVTRRSGSILMISSMAAYYGIDRVVAYAASKSAVEGMVKVLASELSAQGVRVNAIAPGFIE